MYTYSVSYLGPGGAERSGSIVRDWPIDVGATIVAYGRSWIVRGITEADPQSGYTGHLTCEPTTDDL